MPCLFLFISRLPVWFSFLRPSFLRLPAPHKAGDDLFESLLAMYYPENRKEQSRLGK